MNNGLYYYQHLPYYIHPDLSIGFFSVSWYSLMYLLGISTVYLLLTYRIRKNEIDFRKVKSQKSKVKEVTFTNDAFNLINSSFLIDLLLYLFIGLLAGARIGYVLFYNFSYFWNNPLAIISPFNSQGEFIGIYGMSYHGGLIGVVVAALIFCRKNKLNFWSLAEFVVPAIPAGYFWGRLGNFINGELYGRMTTKWWGMYSPLDPQRFLRHPSQLYEALGEGLVLFVILWRLRNRSYLEGKLLIIYLIGYASFRFVLEFFRQPDEQLGFIFGSLTMGQLLSILMLLIAWGIYWRKRRSLV